MELLFLLLMITTQMQQSESESANYALVNCSYQNDSSIEMSFESDGTLCNLFVNATKYIAQCLEDTELVNNSYLLNQSKHSPTTAVRVEHTKFVTITHTQEVYRQTSTTVTVRICPTTSLSQDSHPGPVIPMVSTIYITSSDQALPSTLSTRCSDHANMYTLSTKVVLSNAVQIGILATSGVLICMPISALVIMTYCWIRTRRTLKKKRNDSEVRFHHSAQDSIPSIISEAAPLSVNINPAYAARKPLQKNTTDKDTTLTITSNPLAKESQQSTNTQELAYEIVPLASCQSASTNAHALKN